MSRSFITEGEVISAPAPYDRNPGEAALFGSLVGIALNKYLSGETGQWAVCGVHEQKKTTAQAWSIGAKIYWDNTAKEFTTTSTSNTLAGWAYAAAVNPSTVGQVRLNGTV